MKRPLCLVGTALALAGHAASAAAALREDASPSAGAVDVHSIERRPIVPVPPHPIADGPSPFTAEHRPHPSHRRLAARGPRRKLYHAPTGTFRNLVLLLRFADHADRALPSRDDISRLYTSEDGGVGVANYTDDVAPTGSVRQVYWANSNGAFTVNTTVVDWITLSKPESYYADGTHGFVKIHEAIVEGLNVLDAAVPSTGFDFTDYDLDENGALDGLGIFHSGHGAEFWGDDCHGTPNADRIWSHKGGLDWTATSTGNATVKANRYYASSALHGTCDSNIVRMGVICHELGHYLGLPDLYDYTFQGKGLGAYDFMSQSWGWDGTGLYPPNLSAWSKLSVGWAEAEVIEYDGTYELDASANKVFKIAHLFPAGEYLLLEIRQPTGYDSLLAHGGIAIYHVDELANGQVDRGYPGQTDDSIVYWPENGMHYRVALLSADGGYDLELGNNEGDVGDLWHAGSALTELSPGQTAFPNTDAYQNGAVHSSGVRIFGFSESGAVMTFSVEGLRTRPPTLQPSGRPSVQPSSSSEPSSSSQPSISHSSEPSDTPSTQPTSQPSTSRRPSSRPSRGSSSEPSSQPTEGGTTDTLGSIPSPTYQGSYASSPAWPGVDFSTWGIDDDQEPEDSTAIFK